MTLEIAAEVVVEHFHLAGRGVMTGEEKMTEAMRLGARDNLVG
jgi:hypothetical protein